MGRDPSRLSCDRLRVVSPQHPRALYTDDGETIITVKRPVIINGIEEIATRSDLLDRSILVTLPTIPEEKRIEEGTFWPLFDAAHPRILGALLDAAVMALKRVDKIHPAKLPRMADFAIWVTAAEPALGWEKPADFMTAYAGNREEAHDLALSASPLAGPIHELVAGREKWAGTPTDLLEALNAMVTEQTRKSDGWPRAANALSNKLRVLTPNLRAVGIEVKLPSHKHSSQQRQVVIRKAGEKTAHTAHTAQKEDEPQKNADLPVGDPVGDLGDPEKDRPNTVHAKPGGSKPVGDLGDLGDEKPPLGGGAPAQTIDPDDSANDLEPDMEAVL